MFFFKAYFYSADTRHGTLHPAGWPTLFCGPLQEPELTTANTGKNWKRLWKNAGEWTGRVEIRKKSLAVSVACMAIYWPTPGLKGECLSSVFSPDRTLNFASAAPHCGRRLKRSLFDRTMQDKSVLFNLSCVFLIRKGNFLAVGEVCKSIFWPTPVLTERTLGKCGFSAVGIVPVDITMGPWRRDRCVIGKQYRVNENALRVSCRSLTCAVTGKLFKATSNRRCRKSRQTRSHRWGHWGSHLTDNIFCKRWNFRN